MPQTFLITTALSLVFVFSSFADVVVTRLEPPFQVFVPWADLPNPLIQEIDFNHDGQVDLYFFYDNVYMSASFFAPSQIFITPTQPPPGITTIYGAVAALPFGTVIGSNVVSSVSLGNDLWHDGDKGIPGEDTQYGDRGNSVGYVASDEVVGDPPIVSGEVVGKEGVMALKFFINGQPHFGYIHFDFRSAGFGGFGGYIYGYAYETQPGMAITAARLNDTMPASDGLITSFNHVNGFALTWNAVSGGTYRVQSSTNLMTWADASGDILANQNSVTFMAPPSSVCQCFYRVRRVN